MRPPDGRGRTVAVNLPDEEDRHLYDIAMERNFSLADTIRALINEEYERMYE